MEVVRDRDGSVAHAATVGSPSVAPSTPAVSTRPSAPQGSQSSRAAPGPSLPAASSVETTPTMKHPMSWQKDAYAHLTPQQFQAMEGELKNAEIKYGEKMRQAQAIEDPLARKTKLDALRNSFSTKQSMIRKKYGVRLRERRSKAEIQEERDRMGLSEMGTPGQSPGPTQRPQNSASPSQPPNGQSLPRPPKHPASSGWTAANVVNSEPSAKRIKLEDASQGLPPSSAGGSTASPSRIEAPVPIPQMGGGLSSSNTTATTAATATTVDSSQPRASSPATTLPDRPSSAGLVPSQTSIQSHARVQIYEPEGVPKHPAASAAAVDTASRPNVSAVETGDGDSSSDDDDGDIPARLPLPLSSQVLQRSG